MSGTALALRQVRFENRSFWRNPAAAFFTFVFPLMFLVIFTLIFKEDRSFFVPAIAAFSVITACYTNLAMSITFSRDEGILKRKQGSPLPAAAFLGGRIIHSTLIAILLVAIVVAFGRLVYDVPIPTDSLAAFLLTLMVGAACFSSLGLAVTGLVPNADAAPAIINFSVLPLLFISDIFIPLEDPPTWLTTLAGLFPIKHFSSAMLASFNSSGGDAFRWGDLAVLALWGLAGVVVALRTFSWEPRR